MNSHRFGRSLVWFWFPFWRDHSSARTSDHKSIISSFRLRRTALVPLVACSKYHCSISLPFHLELYTAIFTAQAFLGKKMSNFDAVCYVYDNLSKYSIRKQYTRGNQYHTCFRNTQLFSFPSYASNSITSDGLRELEGE